MTRCPVKHRVEEISCVGSEQGRGYGSATATATASAIAMVGSWAETLVESIQGELDIGVTRHPFAVSGVYP